MAISETNSIGPHGYNPHRPYLSRYYWTKTRITWLVLSILAVTCTIVGGVSIWHSSLGISSKVAHGMLIGPTITMVLLYIAASRRKSVDTSYHHPRLKGDVALMRLIPGKIAKDLEPSINGISDAEVDDLLKDMENQRVDYRDKRLHLKALKAVQLKRIDDHQAGTLIHFQNTFAFQKSEVFYPTFGSEAPKYLFKDISKYSMQVEKVTDAEVNQLLIDIQNHRVNYQDPHLPIVALCATYQKSKLNEDQLLEFIKKTPFIDDYLISDKPFISPPQIHNFNETTAQWIRESYSHPLSLPCFALDERQYELFIQLMKSVPPSEQQFLLVKDLNIPSLVNGIPTSNAAGAAVLFNTLGNIYDQRHNFRIVPSMGMMQMYLYAKFGAEATNIIPTLVPIKFKTIANDWENNAHVLGIPSMALNTHDKMNKADGYFFPAYDFVVHDFYHCVIGSFVPNQYKKLFVELWRNCEFGKGNRREREPRFDYIDMEHHLFFRQELDYPMDDDLDKAKFLSSAMEISVKISIYELVKLIKEKPNLDDGEIALLLEKCLKPLITLIKMMHVDKKRVEIGIGSIVTKLTQQPPKELNLNPKQQEQIKALDFVANDDFFKRLWQ